MKQWDDYYPKELSIETFIGNLFGHREFLAEVFKHKGDKILEVATGTSTMSILGAWFGFDMTSIDINPKIVERARKVATAMGVKVRYQVADTFCLPFPDASFDTAFHQGLMEHFSDSDITRMLDEQLRVAKRVVISVPNFLYPQKDLGNERLLRKEAWERIFKNYKLLKSIYYSPKVFPRFYLPRAKIQYMAVITKP
ncbi:MAG: class I SAM-dependent methyltransferase [Patescibacteria group bacterium]|nr:class I SAM-dependent methyltransferase [Patescibacteria group bacterium]